MKTLPDSDFDILVVGSPLTNAWRSRTREKLGGTKEFLLANFQFEQDIMIQDSRAICYMLRQPSPVNFFLELSF